MSTHPVAPELSPAILPESPLVPNARLREIYTLMLQCRVMHARVSSLVAEGRIAADLLPPAGDEAPLAATAVELRPGDTLCCARRDWLPAMLKGVPLAKIVRWLLSGTARRALSDTAHRLHALPSRPEAQLASLLERAAVHKRKKGSLALAFLDNEIPVEAWQEALALAGRRRLPVLFVCRTGSAHPQAHDYTALTLASQTPHIYVDGSDALALYRVVQEATGRARRNLGATLIECHIENGSTSADPFLAMERHLAAKGVFSPDWKQEIEEAFAHRLEAALLAADRPKSSSGAAVKPLGG